MVDSVRLVNSLVKVPEPIPSVVLSPSIIGSGFTSHTTPLAITLEPPSATTSPPELAESLE